MSDSNIKIWGWGSPDESYDLSSRPFFWPYLKSKLDIAAGHPFSLDDLNKILIPDSRLTEESVHQLKNITGDVYVSIDKTDRLRHSLGKSYHDLLRLREQEIKNVTDAVVYPGNEDEILQILKWAAEFNCAVVPFGGGTSVVGGVEAIKDPGQQAVITIDLRRLDKVLKIDKESMIAEVQAGIFGPQLEAELQKHDCTLSHYPESFEYSTLGGWIAARSAGQQSTRYGKIEDMVESVRLVSPDGITETGAYPAAAHGPSQKQLIIGSEGILGIIVKARVKLKNIPETKSYFAYLLEGFDKGMELCRLMMNEGIKAATVRLSDSEETEFILSLRKNPDSAFKRRAQDWAVKQSLKKGFKPGKRSFLLIGLEGTKNRVRFQKIEIQSLLRGFKSYSLGKGPGKTWYESRFKNPYLRDLLMDHDLLIDTLETSTEWQNLSTLYQAVVSELNKTFEYLKIKGTVTAHISHLYPTGCSLYFIILASPGRENLKKTWQQLKSNASEAIIKAGGSISHHHGIGTDHKRWLEKDIGPLAIKWLRALKQEIDPKNILNPGKLLPAESIPDDPAVRKMGSPLKAIDFSYEKRRQFISKLQEEYFDILVIGGGITGAGVIRDAAMRGYKTALIEKDDFASGTSSKSSKLVHGGFRYLKNLEFGLVHEALMERKNLMNIAPHLVHAIECLFPVYKNSPTPGWLIQLGMLLYDGLSFTKRIGLHKLIPLKGNDKVEPALLKRDLEKLFMYYDSRADDTRLVMANVQSAVQNGAAAVNYIKAIGVIQDGEKVTAIKARDELNGQEFEIRARVVANASGPWCDPLRKELFNDTRRRIRSTKGIHIIVSRKDLPIERTAILTSIQDDRPVFAIPWRNYVLLGTTDTDFDDDPDWVGIGQGDVQYLLDTYNHYYPQADLTFDKVISVYAGLRPLTFEEGKSAGEVTREYQIFESPERFFTIIGGKLTTYRTMADELVDRLGKALLNDFNISAENPKCMTDRMPLYGGDIADYEKFVKDWSEKLIRDYKFDKDIVENLIESYGSRIPDVLMKINLSENGRERILPGLPYIFAEINYTVKHEMAMCLDDFLMRRTHLFSLNKNQALDQHAAVADYMGALLGWSDQEKQKQIERYKAKVAVVQAFRKNSF